MSGEVSGTCFKNDVLHLAVHLECIRQLPISLTPETNIAIFNEYCKMAFLRDFANFKSLIWTQLDHIEVLVLK
jgi:hypothetical protein